MVLVQRIDGAGNVIDAGKIFNAPYIRVQGGANALIIDPQVGDIGLVMLADRDISSIKTSKDAAAPSSRRKHSMADALYIGGILNGTPTQYVQFTNAGINIVSPTKVMIQAPAIEMHGASFTHNGMNVGETHKHNEVTPGTGVSGLPQ